MIQRLVHMTFRPDEVETFRAIFFETAPLIRAFEGCHHVELWVDVNHPERMSTYSRWESEAALNKYRYSDLFRSTWARTKVLFAEPARPQSLVALTAES